MKAVFHAQVEFDEYAPKQPTSAVTFASYCAYFINF